MESEKFPKTCQYCGSLKFERDAVGSLEWMNFRCGSSCDQRGEWSQSDECRITELEAIEAGKDREIKQLRALVSHCWIHSGYRNCGYLQMTTEQKAMYDAIITKEPDHA